MVQNKGIIFKKVPDGFPVPGEHLVIEDRPFDLEQEPPAGGLTIKVYYASFDPYQRGKMRAVGTKSYSAAFDLDQPIGNAAVFKVIKSGTSKFAPGDILASLAPIPTAEYAVLTEDIVERVYKLENPYGLDERYFIGALGMPGLTAWSSFYEIGQPKKGETIFVSAASGAVGQLVGQLAKHEGLTVIGSVGDDKKLDFITKELNFDSGFNYKKEKPIDALARLAPNGIDIYYENVGGEHLEAALESLNNFGKIVACGMISGYNTKIEERYPIRNLQQIVSKRLTVRGFIVSDDNMGPAYTKEHQEKLQKWISEGSFKALQSVTYGIDNAIDGLLGLFKGENFGKAVLQIAELEKN